MERAQTFTRRRVLAGGGAALVAAVGAGVAHAHTLGVTTYARPLRGLRTPVRLAFLTDLHYGLYVGSGQIRGWVDTALDARPDLILLGGDYIDQRLRTAPLPLIRELARLKAPLGVYGVWGNHDYGSFGRYCSVYYGPVRPDWAERRATLTQELRAEGIMILLNHGVAVRDDLHIGGVDDLWNGTPDVRAALAGSGERATILLSHNPDVLPDLPVPAGLVLSGHTHGGQVRLPVIGAPIVPSAFGQRYAMGWVHGAYGTPAYVSRGLGTSGVPLRHLCPPEVTILNLQPS